MRKRAGHTQLPLNLPEPQTKPLTRCSEERVHSDPPNASVYSFAHKKIEKEKSETNRHLNAILKLVRHFK
jgi:hypothetical protein